MAVNPVAVQFGGKSDAFFAELRKVNAGLGELQGEVGKVSKASEAMSRNIARGVAGLVSFAALRSVVRETALAQQGMAQLEAALHSTGEAAGWTKDQLVDMAREMSRASIFGETDLVEAQTRMLTYSSIVGDKVPQAMQIAMDQATRLGMGLSQSAEIIGRALETPSRGVASLTQQGFAFTDSQKAVLKALEETGRLAEAQQIVLDVLSESYGGAAVAARNTFGGALTSVGNAVKELMQGDGSLESATEGVNALADTLRSPELQEGFSLLIGGLTTVVGLLSKTVAGAAGFAKWIGESAAAMIHGPEADDMVRTSEAILALQEKIRRVQAGGGMNPLTGDALPEATVRGLLVAYERDLEKLQRQYADGLERAAVAARQKSVEAAAPTIAPVAAVETEEQRKERLKREQDEFNFNLERTREYWALIGEIETEGLAAGDALAKASFDFSMDLIDAEITHARNSAEERLAIERDLQQQIAGMREQNIDHAVSLLAMLGQRSKAFAVAAIVLERATAIRRIFQNNLVAAQLAFASQLIPGDPTSLARAGAAKGAVLAQGRVAMALAATEGVLQLAMGPSSAVAPGTPNNPIYTARDDDARGDPGVESRHATQIIVHGDIYGYEDFQDKVVDAFGEAVNGRDLVPIRRNSRQAQELLADPTT